jgi:hypothetical protein
MADAIDGPRLRLEGEKMVLIECLFALAAALFLTVVFTVIGRQAKSSRRVIVFFLVVFLGAWAGGVWIMPVGPSIQGVYWITFFAVGLVFALVLEAVTAFSGRSSRPAEAEAQSDKKEEREIESVLGVFFWILLALFIGAIALGHLARMR